MNTNNSDLNKDVNAQTVEENVSSTTETTSNESAKNEVKETETTENVKTDEEKKETSTEDTSSSSTNDKDKTTTTTAVTTTTTVTTKPTTEVKPLELKNIDADFIFDVLSVPTYSRHEYRMVTFIILWARENGIKYEFDDYGNIYLTKGEVSGDECYPCVTSHLDTVQNNQELYAQLGIPLKLNERVNSKGGHELYVDGMGIGADDKAGVLISLQLFKFFDKLKACFFLEEEVGCLGSKKLNKKWFDNVGYVIGWDSPDRNRAAYACSGELLFSKEFFEKIESTCKEHGLDNFNSEPFTDVKEIRQQTEVVCMNFGNGGYNAHMSNEYVIMEDIDAAVGLGVALINLLGTEKFRMKSKSAYAYGVNKSEDAEYFDKKFNKFSTTTRGSYYNQGSTYNRNYNGGSTSTTTTTTTKTTQFKDEDKVDSKVLEHIVERYETFIDDIQKKVEQREATLLNEIKQLCEETGADYSKFLDIFVNNPSTDPFSTAIEF